MCAEDLMDRPFVTAYSDILFTREVVRELVHIAGRAGARRRYRLARALPAAHPASAARCGEGDHARRPGRARPSHHPLRGRRPASSSAWRSSAPAARSRFRDFYHRRKAQYWGKPYREAAAVPEGVPDPHVPGHDRARHRSSATSTRRATTARSTRRRTWTSPRPCGSRRREQVPAAVPRLDRRLDPASAGGARADREAALGRRRHRTPWTPPSASSWRCRSAPGSTW